MALHRTLQGSPMARDPGLPRSSPHASVIKCPQHYMETLRKHGRKKLMDQVAPRMGPCPTVDFPGLDSSLDHTLDVLTSGRSTPRLRVQRGLAVWARGQSDQLLLRCEFCRPGCCGHPLPPKGLVSVTPTCQQLCQLPWPSALIR